MTNIAKLYNSENQTQFFGPARILTVDNEKRTARIYLDNLSGIQEIQATLTLPFEIELSPGDKVLVIGENLDAIYIIGVLSVKSPSIVRSKDGSYAQLTEIDGRPSLQIFSKNNELIVEYDTDNNKTKLHSESGNLEFSAPSGDITFHAAKSLLLKGETVTIEGRKKVDASVQGFPGSHKSSLSIGSYNLKMKSSDLSIISRKGNLFFEELKLSSKNMLSNLVQATIKIDKFDVTAQSIISKAKNIYQSVENLSQLKTGRLKTLIRSTYHLKSNKTVMKAEKDFKIKAEKIDLG